MKDLLRDHGQYGLKRVNVVYVFVHVCRPTSIVMKTTASLFFILIYFNDPAPTQTCTSSVLYLAMA